MQDITRACLTLESQGKMRGNPEEVLKAVQGKNSQHLRNKNSAQTRQTTVMKVMTITMIMALIMVKRFNLSNQV